MGDRPLLAVFARYCASVWGCTLFLQPKTKLIALGCPLSRLSTASTKQRFHRCLRPIPAQYSGCHFSHLHVHQLLRPVQTREYHLVEAPDLNICNTPFPTHLCCCCWRRACPPHVGWPSPDRYDFQNFCAAPSPNASLLHLPRLQHRCALPSAYSAEGPRQQWLPFVQSGFSWDRGCSKGVLAVFNYCPPPPGGGEGPAVTWGGGHTPLHLQK